MDIQKLSKICDSANKTEFTEEEETGKRRFSITGRFISY